MDRRIVTAAAALGTLAMLAAAALMPYAGIRRADARRLETAVARPIATGQPAPQALEDPLVRAIYRRGQYYRRGGSDLMYFTHDEAREPPAWEPVLAEVRQADFVPSAFKKSLIGDPEPSAYSWDAANFWRLDGMPSAGLLANWSLIAEPESGKAVYVSLYLESPCEMPDLEASLDAYCRYLGLDGLSGWEGAQIPSPRNTIFTKTCPDAQLALTATWQGTASWSSLTFSANSPMTLDEQEELS